MPRLLKRFLLRLRATLSAQQDRDTRAELDLHLGLLEEEYLAKGMARDGWRGASSATPPCSRTPAATSSRSTR
jgi:hypothetical protein